MVAVVLPLSVVASGTTVGAGDEGTGLAGRPVPVDAEVFDRVSDCLRQGGIDIDLASSASFGAEERHARLIQALDEAYGALDEEGRERWHAALETLQGTCLKDIVSEQAASAAAQDQQLTGKVEALKSSPSFEAARAAWEACLEDAGVDGLRAIEDTTPFIQRHAEAALDALTLPEVPRRPLPVEDDSQYEDVLEEGREAIAEVMAREDVFETRVRGVVASCLASTAYQEEIDKARQALERELASDGLEGSR